MSRVHGIHGTNVQCPRWTPKSNERESKMKVTKKSMTKVEKKVAIAKDVLKRLNKLRFDGVGYCESKRPMKKLEGKGQLQKHLPIVEKSCYVCALGATFLSYIRLFNKVRVEDVAETFFSYEGKMGICVPGRLMEERLETIFPHKTVVLIEAAYEGDTHIDSYYASDSNGVSFPKKQAEVDKAVSFGKKHRGKRNRIKAIMKNIVKNKGEFVP